jgi:hypothetical protein
MTVRKPRKITEIFVCYWKEYLATHSARETERINVKKMLICRTPFLGKHVYACPTCDYQIEVPHSCKSRFCSVCGYKSTEDWVAIQFNRILNCGYHHVVITVPKLYRWMIKLDRVTTLNMFSRLAAETLKEWTAGRGYEPGVICFFHSFGSWLQFHPHFHMLVTIGGVTPSGNWKYTSEQLPGQVFMEKFRAKFMAEMKRLFKEDRLKTKTKLNRVLYQINMTFNHHWQFYTERITSKGAKTMLYCVRYAKKMIISELRIIEVNHQTRKVSFFSADRKTLYVYDVMQFIKQVVQHIPEKHFRQIKYYGFYATASKKYLIAAKYWEPLQRTRQKLTWSQRQRWYHGLSPMICPVCKIKLILKLASYPIPLRRLHLDDIILIYFSRVVIHQKLKMEYG